MNKKQATELIQTTFPEAFDKARFRAFAINVLNHVDEGKAFSRNSTYVKEAFRAHVQRFERLGTYTSPGKEKADVLIVYLTAESKLERARTAIRNFVADHLKDREEKDAALVAFVSPTEKQWRLSYVKMEYATVEKESGKVGVETRLTPARRFSYLVGEGESCHTAQTRFLDLLQDTATDPTLAQIEEAFSVEAVTKEFFAKYAELFGDINTALEKLVAKDKTLRDEFKTRGVNTVDFAKKLMGQIVFLYFLQKKGWLGVEKGKDWGTGPRHFLRRMARGEYGKYDNFFNDILEPLFYDTLATDRGHDAWCNRFKCRIPFLNGGLFEPLADYDWKKTDVILPNRLFTNDDPAEEGITGTGILDVFDRYNFTVNEAEPLEKEVAIDPEMLGKVFENLIEENRRKGLGAFYTPREIVHYMCQESLINYLETSVTTVPRADIETFVRLGEQISHYEAVDAEYKIKMPKSIEKSAKALDDSLRSITVCDPAVGSGAFPVGMMTEVVRARATLTPYFNDIGERTPYHFKRHAIQNCLYGVDIDSSAVDIAKLRLWLSLVVDEEDVKQVKPLPNLDYKIVVGNSLIELLSSASLHASTDAVRSDLVNRLKSAKDQMFDLTSSDQKKDKREEIDRLFQDLFEHDRKKQIEGIGQRLANIRAQGQLFEEGSRKEQSLIHALESSMEVIRQIQIPKPTEHFEWGICFSEVFQKKQGFDVVIANPPYGFHQIHTDSAKSYFKAHFTASQGSFEHYLLFYEASLKLLRVGGVQAFIAPVTWLTIPSARSLRRFVLTDYAVSEICWMAEEVFQHASVNTLISVIQRTPPRNTRVKFFKRLMTFPRNPDCERTIPQEAFVDGDYYISIFSEPGEVAIVEKMRKSSRPLAEIAQPCSGYNPYEVGSGVAPEGGPHTEETVRDKPYHSEKQRGGQWKPEIVGRDLSRFHVHVTGQRWVKYGPWLAAPRDPQNFTGKRILVQEITGGKDRRIVAAIYDGELYHSRDVIPIKIITQDPHPLYLLGVVNSWLISWYHHRCSPKAQKGLFPKVLVSDLKQLPVRHVPSGEQRPIVKAVEQIIAAKQRNAAADTNELEREIDQMVYRLYDLTSDEIAQIEGALAETRRPV